MKTARILYAMMRADFLERTRRYSFLLTLGFTVYAAYKFLPPAYANYVTLRMGEHRGIYNSAWVGAAVSLLTGAFLSLAGFYLVKNALDRDQQTRVGQILAATPLSRPLYTLGKALSNFAFLATMASVVAVVAGITQLVRSEDTHLVLWDLFAPFVLLSLPVLAFVAAIAILAETLPGMRGGLGNVVYFFFWSFLLAASGGSSRLGQRIQWSDALGWSAVIPSMQAACHAAFPDYDPLKGGLAMGINIRETPWALTTFVWEGASWGAGVFVQRGFWIAMAVAVALLASVFFHRFDPAAWTAPRSGERVSLVRRAWRVLFGLFSRKSASDSEVAQSAPPPAHIHLTPLPAAAAHFRFFSLVAAELRLIFKGLSWFWFLVAGGLVLAGLLNNVETGRALLTAAWIWPLLLWSPMGTRESRHNTERLIFSSAHALQRQLPAVWTAGFLVALLTGSGVAARWMLAGETHLLVQWLVGAFFIPSLALALGVWSGSSKAFEILYLMLWYLGPLNRLPELDFLGASPQSFAIGTHQTFLAATLVLLALAVPGRLRQLRGSWMNLFARSSS